jgi:hypothetical protein
MEPVDRLREVLEDTPMQRPVRRASDAIRRRVRRPRARRLTFAYNESGLNLVSHADRLKPAPPSDRIDQPTDPRSVVAELHALTGEVVYRRRIPGAFPTDVEVPDPAGRMHRAPARRSSGTLSVIVPIRRKASHVVIAAGPQVSGIPFDTGQAPVAAGGAVLLGSFPLDHLPQAGRS